MEYFQIPVSIGYLSYFLVKGNDVYATIDRFMEIKADPFLLDYLKEFKERKLSHDYIIIVIALFSSSLYRFYHYHFLIGVKSPAILLIQLKVSII